MITTLSDSVVGAYYASMGTDLFVGYIFRYNPGLKNYNNFIYDLKPFSLSF